MSSPRVIVQIAIAGAQIVGKALAAAGRQAIKNAKYSPQAAIGGDAAGVGDATSGLTREHRMALEEAHMILNVNKAEPMEKALERYQHLFKANSPPSLAKPQPGQKPTPPPAWSHYIQSKIVRARERIEAEAKAAEQPTAPSEPPSSTTPGPDGKSS